MIFGDFSVSSMLNFQYQTTTPATDPPPYHEVIHIPYQSHLFISFLLQIIPIYYISTFIF